MTGRRAIVMAHLLTRVLLAWLLGLTALVGCASRAAREEQPIGDDPRLIGALLTPTDLGRGWERVDAERFSHGFAIGPPCARYGMFGDADATGRAAVSLFNAASARTVHQTIVETRGDIAAEAMRGADAELDCREWQAYGDDPTRTLTFYIAPIAAPRGFADDTTAYSFWNDDDPTRPRFAGNVYIIRSGSVVLQITHVADEDAPDRRETEALVAQAVEKLRAAADRSVADDLAQAHRGAVIDWLRWPGSEEGAQRHPR